MKRKHFVRLAILIVACAAALCSPAAAKEFVMGTIADVNSPMVKTRIAFMKECFKAHGYDLTVKSMPAVRSLQAADKGEIDGDLFREYNLNEQEYPNLIRAGYPITYLPFFGFVSDPAIKARGIKGVKDLAQYKVVTQRGDRIVEKAINPLIPKDKLTVVASYEQAFKMLDAGRVDVVVSDRARASHELTKLGLSHKILMVIPPLMIPNTYPYFNRKHAALAEEIAKTMKAKMDDGTYLKLTGVPPPDPKTDHPPVD